MQASVTNARPVATFMMACLYELRVQIPRRRTRSGPRNCSPSRKQQREANKSSAPQTTHKFNSRALLSIARATTTQMCHGICCAVQAIRSDAPTAHALWASSAVAHLQRHIVQELPAQSSARRGAIGQAMLVTACRNTLKSHGEIRRLSIHHLQVAKRLAVQLTPSDLNVFLREAHSQHCLPPPTQPEQRSPLDRIVGETSGSAWTFGQGRAIASAESTILGETSGSVLSGFREAKARPDSQSQSASVGFRLAKLM